MAEIEIWCCKGVLRFVGKSSRKGVKRRKISEKNIVVILENNDQLGSRRKGLELRCPTMIKD